MNWQHGGGRREGEGGWTLKFETLMAAKREGTVICILFCTTNFREHYLVVLQFDIFGQ